MNIPIDIHTHHCPTETSSAIVNSYPSDFRPCEGCFYSVGIHPRRVESDNAAPVWEALGKAVLHPQVIAVGEAGFDKLAEVPLDLQAEVFHRQALLAEEAGKPLIIHLVRAADELLAWKCRLRPSVPWVIHGFRGKPALAAMWLRHGFYLSFGVHYSEKAMCSIPAGRLLLETDDSGADISGLCLRAAAVRGVPPAQLLHTLHDNVRHVFFAH